MTRTFFSVIAVMLILSAAFAESEIWLDQSLSNWNQPSARVPQAPASSSDYASRCKTQARPPENLADQALVGSGWIPFGAFQSYGSTSIITAMSEADPSCRPRNYQAFVFSGENVAGTLSPSLMDSNSEGSIRQIRLLSANEIEVDFARMPTSEFSTVRFEIRQDPTGPVVVPLEIRHSKKEPPAPLISSPPVKNPEEPATTEPAMPKVIPPATTKPATPKDIPPATTEPATPKDIPPVTQEARSDFLRPISNPSLLKGCGCFLKAATAARPDDPYIFVTNILIEKRAWVNIAGEDISLNILRSTMPKEKKFKVKTGYEFQEEYVAGHIHIIVDYVVKKLPAESQSFAEYDATLTITAGERKETIAASGICGCMKTP